MRLPLSRLGLLLFVFISSCKTQSQDTESVSEKIVGGPCQGCEAIFEYGSKVLNEVDTLPLFKSGDPKIKLFGKVLKKDGKTPASNVILYVYHTNSQGIYEKQGDEQGWGKRHGFIRGWVKTGEDGEYSFYTFRPGAYPNRRAPEHVHITVKETGLKEYYIEDFFFDDDPLLTKEERKRLRNRGGSGIVRLKSIDGVLTARRDIILGLNIPDYD